MPRQSLMAHADINIDYILVVGQFGLATGSGKTTQSKVHTTSRVHQINNVDAPLPKVMVHSNPAGTIPLQLLKCKCKVTKWSSKVHSCGQTRVKPCKLNQGVLHA